MGRTLLKFMKYILTIAFLISVAYGQLNVKNFGAIGNGIADDHAAIQAAIDSSVKKFERVYIPPGRYRITKPLMVYNWYGNQYSTVTTTIYGDDNMWSGGICTIISDFKDGFALGIQRGKGVIVKGIIFQGKYTPPNITFDSIYRTTLSQYKDTSVRDTRYSPSAAIVIDPFSGNIPSDGGYPQMISWYKGPQVRSGSTGCRFEDITINNHNIGFITSPNGYTQNAEILTFENIRIQETRIGFVGCQAQEKLNRVINLGAWGRTHTLFVWNTYGFAQPGHWVIDGVNVAGQVVNLVYRASVGFFPLHIYNVFAESMGSIGYWTGGVGDALSNSSINLIYPDHISSYSNSTGQLGGLTFNNTNIRYYGQTNTPIVFGNASYDLKFNNTISYVPAVWGRLSSISDSVDMGSYYLKLVGYVWANSIYKDGNNRKAIVDYYRNQANVGESVIIVNMSDRKIFGMAKVSEVNGSKWTMDYISPFQQNISYYLFTYKKK